MPRPLDYSGLVAETYDQLVPEDLGDVDFFRRAIQPPALEIACGTGRLLLRYAAEGLDVEGVDSSADMLAVCRRKAARRGSRVTLHQQAMESLHLPRRYRTLYVPAGSLMLLTEDARIDAALAGFHRHLDPGGKLLVALDEIAFEPEGEWRLRRESAAVRCWERATYDLAAQIKRSRIRYETAGRIVEFDTSLRWHTPEQFEARLRDAGFVEIRVTRGESLFFSATTHTTRTPS
ncbi:MAG: class I SAM-dependent methyltransferase [Bryobacteraceae bacterium]